MTAQSSDVFILDGNEYSISGISEGELFNPESLGMKPTGLCSGCWRGYMMYCAIVNGKLVIKNLHINLIHNKRVENKNIVYDNIVGPLINGVSPKPKKERNKASNNFYDDIDLHLNYSGGLLLASDFIEELYVHMGFHPAWKFRNVIELVFENGVLLQKTDMSSKMAEIRKKYLNKKTNSIDTSLDKEEIEKFIDQSFDRRYKRH